MTVKLPLVTNGPKIKQTKTVSLLKSNELTEPAVFISSAAHRACRERGRSQNAGPNTGILCVNKISPEPQN